LDTPDRLRPNPGGDAYTGPRRPRRRRALLEGVEIPSSSPNNFRLQASRFPSALTRLADHCGRLLGSASLIGCAARDRAGRRSGRILVKRKVVTSRIGPYAVATAGVLLAAAGQVAAADWVDPLASLAVLFPAIVAGALLGAGPGVLSLGLSLALGWSCWTWMGGSISQGGPGALEFSLFAFIGATIVLIIEAYRWRESPFSAAGLLFKAVQDISLEGVVVYRPLLNRDGQVRDFEYRYANPAARAIMVNPGSEGFVGAKLLERLPLAREHPQLFPRYVRVFTTGETSEAEYSLGGRWFHSTAAKLGDGIVVTVQDVSVRRRAEDAQKLLLQELSHRVKNLLASVIAMAESTERTATSTAEFRDKLSARLQALARAHGLLISGAWTDAAVGDVVRSTLEPHLQMGAGRFNIDGPIVRVSSDVALALNMALHELATNAIKYGALSDQRGHIGIRWELDANRPGFVRMYWTESGGPLMSPPTDRGFGTRLLERAFAATDGKVQLHFLPEGLSCEMRFAGTAILQQAVA
jgi:two-component sensor histidine kinase